MTRYKAYKLTNETIDLLKGSLGGDWKRLLIKDNLNKNQYKYVAVVLGSISVEIRDYLDNPLFCCTVSDDIETLGASPLGWTNLMEYKSPKDAVLQSLKKAQRMLLREVAVLNKNVDKMTYLKRSNQFQIKPCYKLI